MGYLTFKTWLKGSCDKKFTNKNKSCKNFYAIQYNCVLRFVMM